MKIVQSAFAAVLLNVCLSSGVLKANTCTIIQESYAKDRVFALAIGDPVTLRFNATGEALASVFIGSTGLPDGRQAILYIKSTGTIILVGEKDATFAFDGDVPNFGREPVIVPLRDTGRNCAAVSTFNCLVQLRVSRVADPSNPIYRITAPQNSAELMLDLMENAPANRRVNVWDILTRHSRAKEPGQSRIEYLRSRGIGARFTRSSEEAIQGLKRGEMLVIDTPIKLAAQIIGVAPLEGKGEVWASSQPGNGKNRNSVAAIGYIESLNKLVILDSTNTEGVDLLTSISPLTKPAPVTLWDADLLQRSIDSDPTAGITMISPK